VSKIREEKSAKGTFSALTKECHGRTPECSTRRSSVFANGDIIYLPIVADRLEPHLPPNGLRVLVHPLA